MNQKICEAFSELYLNLVLAHHYEPVFIGIQADTRGAVAVWGVVKLDS